MQLIKIILVVGFLLSLLFSFRVLSRSLALRFFLFFLLGGGILLVIFPEWAQLLAELVGVGRGTDLVLYCLVLLVLIGALLILGKLRHLQLQLTELARQLALQQAQKGKKQNGSAKI